MHWEGDRLLATSTDPWTYGAGYSVRPVARAIKTKHAGLNPCVLGSVHKLTGDVTSGTDPALAALCAYWAGRKIL
jgi:hypothetical protein